MIFTWDTPFWLAKAMLAPWLNPTGKLPDPEPPAVQEQRPAAAERIQQSRSRPVVVAPTIGLEGRDRG